jgi:multidrug efflux pump subunit AcrA (membrane-fusion protein)
VVNISTDVKHYKEQIMNQINAMRQALEALQNCANREDDVRVTRDALDALRQAIEQAGKVEPVAKVVLTKPLRLPCLQWLDLSRQFDMEDGQLLYTHPPTAPAQPTFVKHEVESAEDWSELVCPDPDEYLIKCCDCGLVHEAQFRVAEYKPTPSEEFVVTNNPDMQTQFRMKRHSAPGAQLKDQS